MHGFRPSPPSPTLAPSKDRARDGSVVVAQHRRFEACAGQSWVPALFIALAVALVIAIAYQLGQFNDDPQGVATGPVVTPPPPPSDAPAEPGEPADNAPAERPRADIQDAATVSLETGLAQVERDLADFRLRLDYDLIATSDGAKQFWEARMELLEYLENLDPAYAGPVVDFLHTADNHLQRRVLLLGLGAIGGDVAAEGLADHYETWGDKDRTEAGVDTEIKYTIAALGKIDNDLSFDLLHHYVNASPQRDRSRLVEALGVHNRRIESVPVFVDLAANDSMIRVRNKAAQALGRTADPRSAGEIERMIDNETQAPVKQTLIGSLGKIGDPKSLDKLDQVLRNEQNTTTRMSAIRSTRVIGGSRARSMLERVVEEDADRRVRSFARKELTLMDDIGQ
ncbi:MAG: HEAT repeat domain-containing protein [Planctomycetota bacterium]